MNYSADPSRYPQSPCIVVECVNCDAKEKAFDRHEQNDAAIKRKHFPRWKVKGCFGAKRTLCPSCANKSNMRCKRQKN